MTIMRRNMRMTEKNTSTTAIRRVIRGYACSRDGPCFRNDVCGRGYVVLLWFCLAIIVSRYFPRLKNKDP
jgi:hypothetical protein